MAQVSIPMKGKENGMIIKMDASRLHSIFLLSCVSLFVSACFYIKPCFHRSKYPSSSSSSSSALFVFGSSVFDPGNNNYINTTTSNQANFWPYGETYFRYPTGRFSDGRLISDFITEYAQLPLFLPYLHPSYQSYIHGANFASGGSGALVQTNEGLEIHINGGRKFGFLGLWNLGCLPSSRMHSNDASCLEEGSFLTKLHNTQLSLLLQELEKQLEGFKYTYTHSYDFITEMTDNPLKYGFKEGKVACCGSGPYRGESSCGGKRGIDDYELCENPDEYVFFDYAHLSERANQFFAHQMWSGDSNVTWPHNLITLFEE